MAYVVTQACIGNKHTSCVDVCPVEAFREGPEMLYIDPAVCIDCNACLTECPERAIFPQTAVPDEMRDFIQLNEEKAQIYPVIRESIGHDVAASPVAAFAGRFAVVGSGPSGFYAAEELLKQMPAAQVDMFERLPTPFGLVRYGVAPDHPRIKSVSASFERIAEHARFRFFGNVQIGQEVTRDDLVQRYDGVIYATGGAKSRELTIPGATLPNIFGSSVFVGWYNGHPDHRRLQVDLTEPSAVVIGIGNVALDIARMLVLDPDVLAKTDVADEALALFNTSKVEEVCLVARRGPAQAAFTPKELEQLMTIAGLQLIVDPLDLELDSETQAQLQLPEFSEVRQNMELLRQIAQRTPSLEAGSKAIRFIFNASPLQIDATHDGVKEMILVRNEMQRDERGRISAVATGQTFNLHAGLIVHAIGYQGDAVAGVPFDAQRGVISHVNGRISNGVVDTGSGEYAAGWIKRGASGVIGSNKHCASDTVGQMLLDLAGKNAGTDLQDIELLLKERQVNYIDFADWRLLDQHELEQGRIEGRARRKITDVNAMLKIIRDARAQREADENARAQLPVKTHFRTCTLCEAMCGVKIEYQGDKILSVAGDADDQHSQGHICPKGYSLQDLHNDPDRLKKPLHKVNGEWQPIEWDDAFDLVAERFVDIQARHGNDAIAGYWGNPTSHNLGLLLATGKFRKALGSRNLYTAASLDQMPHQVMSYLMFGHGQIFTIPDIDRTDYMLMLGANPAASNGSLMSSGDVLRRLQAIKERGGKLVLLDPRKTESAIYASEHHYIRPTTDALFLIGLIQHIVRERLFDPGHLLPLSDQWDQLTAMFEAYELDNISALCGIPASEIKRIAEEFAAAEKAVCYGRMGVSAQSFGTLNHWLMNVLNILTGNLDSPGGSMFTQPAVNMAIKPSTAGSFNQYQSRVSGLPEFNREFPTTVMAEEMLVPGEGQIKAFICMAGNPVLSAPNGRQLDAALEQLEFVVSVDFYLNETSRHADLILPPTGPLEHEQYDLVFNLLAVRNVAKFAEPLFESPEDSRSDWDIMQGITKRITRLKQGGDPVPGKPEIDPVGMVDFGLRSGPYGEKFSAYINGEPVEQEQGLSLKVLKQFPHGLDLGPMQSCLPEYLFTRDKKINLIPPPVLEDLQRLDTFFDSAVSESEADAQPLILIGRRDLRTNNSWMHNSKRLVKGKDRCALLMHPQDAAGRGIKDRDRVTVSSRVGELEVDVRLSEDLMPGVVSLPHGWGHNREGIALQVAQSNPGVSVNDLTDDQLYDRFTGNAALNGVPVRISAVG